MTSVLHSSMQEIKQRAANLQPAKAGIPAVILPRSFSALLGSEDQQTEILTSIQNALMNGLLKERVVHQSGGRRLGTSIQHHLGQIGIHAIIVA